MIQFIRKKREFASKVGDISVLQSRKQRIISQSQLYNNKLELYKQGTGKLNSRRKKKLLNKTHHNKKKSNIPIKSSQAKKFRINMKQRKWKTMKTPNFAKSLPINQNPKNIINFMKKGSQSQNKFSSPNIKLKSRSSTNLRKKHFTLFNLNRQPPKLSQIQFSFQGKDERKNSLFKKSIQSQMLKKRTLLKKKSKKEKMIFQFQNPSNKN